MSPRGRVRVIDPDKPWRTLDGREAGWHEDCIELLRQHVVADPDGYLRLSEVKERFAVDKPDVYFDSHMISSQLRKMFPDVVRVWHRRNESVRYRGVRLRV